MKIQFVILLFGIFVFSVTIFTNFEISYTLAQLPTNYVVDEFEFPGGIGPIAINPNTNLVYVTNPFSDTITVLDGNIYRIKEKTKIKSKTL